MRKRYPDEGYLLKAIRIERLGITQEQLAKNANVKTQVIENLEQGKTSCRNMKYSTLEPIAKALGESPTTLIKLLETKKESI